VYICHELDTIRGTRFLSYTETEMSRTRHHSRHALSLLHRDRDVTNSTPFAARAFFLTQRQRCHELDTIRGTRFLSYTETELSRTRHHSRHALSLLHSDRETVCVREFKRNVRGVYVVTNCIFTNCILITNCILYIYVYIYINSTHHAHSFSERV